MAEKNRRLLIALGAMAAGVVVATLLIQLQDRYLFLLVPLASVPAGLGVAILWEGSQLAAGILIAGLVLAGVHMSLISASS